MNSKTSINKPFCFKVICIKNIKGFPLSNLTVVKYKNGNVKKLLRYLFVDCKYTVSCETLLKCFLSEILTAELAFPLKKYKIQFHPRTSIKNLENVFN